MSHLFSLSSSRCRFSLWYAVNNPKKLSVATLTSSTLIMIWTKIDTRLMLVIARTLPFRNQTQAQVDGSLSGGPKKSETVSLEEIALQFRSVQDITLARNVRD